MVWDQLIVLKWLHVFSKFCLKEEQKKLVSSVSKSLPPADDGDNDKDDYDDDGGDFIFIFHFCLFFRY